MSQSERWVQSHGFTEPHIYRNDRGENLCALLDTKPTVTHSVVIHERWTFGDSSSIVLRHVFWVVKQAI